MKIFIINMLLCLCLCACNGPEAYLHHNLEFRKAGDDCSRSEGRFSMNSNTNGERYVFQQCLDRGFSERGLELRRQGDTVVVGFKTNGGAQALFDITLDIDTYPRYHFLTIGENTFPIRPAGN